MPAVLFHSSRAEDGVWRERLSKRIPGLDFRVYPDVGDKADIEFALAWYAGEGAFIDYPNLKAICSLGQGVDHLLKDSQLPEQARILRIVDPWMGKAMAEWITLQVLRFHRSAPEYERLEAEKRWEELPHVDNPDRRVGILGLGALGAEAARTLLPFGFDIAGWSRSRKQVEGVESFAGAEELDAFLARTDILCCLLPLTPETTDIINLELLNKLPKGAYVINAGRGLQLVEEDLLTAIESGQIAGACLDVFRKEPLPAEHPFWDHPKVQVWPHVSAPTNPESAADQIAENIRRIFAGEEPINEAFRDRGY